MRTCITGFFLVMILHYGCAKGIGKKKRSGMVVSRFSFYSIFALFGCECDAFQGLSFEYLDVKKTVFQDVW